MQIQILHTMGACSSLILYGFDPSFNGTRDVNLESFVSDLKNMIKVWEYSIPAVTKYLVQDFAFMVASTSHKQPVAEECLRKLGFTESERVKKNKNPDHEVKFWVVSIPVLFSNLGLES